MVTRTLCQSYLQVLFLILQTTPRVYASISVIVLDSRGRLAICLEERGADLSPLMDFLAMKIDMVV